MFKKFISLRIPLYDLENTIIKFTDNENKEITFFADFGHGLRGRGKIFGYDLETEETIIIHREDADGFRKPTMEEYEKYLKIKDRKIKEAKQKANNEDEFIILE